MDISNFYLMTTLS
ncbi:hypothetical protein ACHAW6_000291 [Cyclotella cf. meneghiniana]